MLEVSSGHHLGGVDLTVVLVLQQGVHKRGKCLVQVLQGEGGEGKKGEDERYKS